jgi:ribosome-binding protein aMBF1 (putative translation factor)
MIDCGAAACYDMGSQRVGISVKLCMRTVEHLLEQTGLSIDELASRAKIDVERAEAIADGRWTPSPKERERIAAAFGVPLAEISWGHTMNPRNVRYRRFGLKENF